jgi:hypothetical protein
MDKIIANLFAARDISHALHLKTKSFAVHVALNDFYDALIELIDGLAEMYQGKYGVMQDTTPDSNGFPTNDAEAFIKNFTEWAETAKTEIPQDSFIQNEWDAVIATAFKARYKIENLK